MNLILGDGLTYLKEKIADNSIDLIVTDPPYDVATTGGGGTVNRVKGLNRSLKGLDEADIADGYDIALWGREFTRVMKKLNLYIWCNKVQIPDYFNFYVNELGCKFDIICWHKPNALPTYSNKYLSDTEYCLYFRQGGRCQPETYDDARTFYVDTINAVDKKKFGHPTVKPLSIIEKLIRNSSTEGEVILDPFMGSGTTGVACRNLNREFIGIEINSKWFKVAENRINDSNILF